MVKNRLQIILLITYLLFPTGIGLSVFGNNLDLNKILYIFIVLSSLRSILNLKVKLEGSLAVLFLLFALIMSSMSWLSSFQYLFFTYILFSCFSSYFIARLIFSERLSIVYFVNNIALAYLCVGIIGLLNYYFGLVDINFLRPEAESYAHAYTRGAITPNQELIGYKGSFSNTHWFAIDRFIWMSLSACFLWYANRTKDHSINKHVLMVSIAVGSCEIILSQARVLSLVSVILFLYSLYAYKKIYIVYLTAFLLIVSPLIKDYAFFYYTNIYSLAGILFEDTSGFSYTLGTDKRYQAIIGILENFEQIIFAPLGPLFWNFSPLVLGTQSEYFDDLYPMINIIPEYGLFPLVFFLLLIARALKFSRGLFYRPLFFWLLLTLLASVANYMPKFYFYAFFAIGALIGARSIFHKQLDSQF